MLGQGRAAVVICVFLGGALPAWALVAVIVVAAWWPWPGHREADPAATPRAAWPYRRRPMSSIALS